VRVKGEALNLAVGIGGALVGAVIPVLLPRSLAYITSLASLRTRVAEYGYPETEYITDTKSTSTNVGVPKLSITSYKWPASAVLNAVVSGGFQVTVSAPADADCPSSFCGFVNKSGNPGAISVYVPGIGWTDIPPGNRFVAALGTIAKGTSYTYGPRDLMFKAVGTYDVDIIAGVIV